MYCCLVSLSMKNGFLSDEPFFMDGKNIQVKKSEKWLSKTAENTKMDPFGFSHCHFSTLNRAAKSAHSSGVKSKWHMSMCVFLPDQDLNCLSHAGHFKNKFFLEGT